MRNEDFRTQIELLELHNASKKDRLITEVMRTKSLNQQARSRIKEVKKEIQENENTKKEEYEPNLIVVRIKNEHDTARRLLNKIHEQNPDHYVLILHKYQINTEYGLIHGFKDGRRVKIERLPKEENEAIELILTKLRLLKKIREAKKII